MDDDDGDDDDDDYDARFKSELIHLLLLYGPFFFHPLIWIGKMI
jgi:hypothetical protein